MCTSLVIEGDLFPSYTGTYHRDSEKKNGHYSWTSRHADDVLEMVTLYWYRGVDMGPTWRLEGDKGVYHLQDAGVMDGDMARHGTGTGLWERIIPDGSSSRDHSIEIVCNNSKVPSEEPTEQPTEEPTEQPSEEPSQKPTEEPSEEPTEEPTEEPSEEPTLKSSNKRRKPPP